MIATEIKEVVKSSGFNVAGWVITSTIVIVALAYIYNQYLSIKKLDVDYQISQYQLEREKAENPQFQASKT
jgi:hypothetical protein